MDKRLCYSLYLVLLSQFAQAQTTVVELESTFDTGNDDWTYLDDAFGTSNPYYASGSFLSRSGNPGGTLSISLGGIDDDNIDGMSGGWERSFNLSEEREVWLEFDYQLTMARGYESDEYSEVLVSVDGFIWPALVRLTGDGDGGSEESTGWVTANVNLGSFSPGEHTIILGGFNNLKTIDNEDTQILLDNVKVLSNSKIKQPREPTEPVTDPTDESLSLILETDFSSGAGSFSYKDDTFERTSAPYYADGEYRSNGGEFGDGALRVKLGGIDDDDIDGMSGGYVTSFDLDQDVTHLVVTVKYRLQQSAEYESEEFSQARLTVDGDDIGSTAGVDYLSQIRGDDEDGPPRSTGWQTVYLQAGALSAGAHELVIGAYNNIKTKANEETTIDIDSVVVKAGPLDVGTVPPPPPPLTESPMDSPVDSPAGSKGKWSGPYDTSIVVAAAANLPSGQIVGWSAYSRIDFGGTRGSTYTVIVDPETTRVDEELISNTNHDMFCPGTATLEDGRIMVTGGSGNRATSFYDPKSDSWRRGKNMAIRRGYHAMTVLGDGSVFTIGGSWGGGQSNTGGKYGELYRSGSWISKSNLLSETLQTGDSKGAYRADNHMWLFTAPNGKIFHPGPSRQMHWIDVDGSDGIRMSLRRGDDDDAMNGNAVMYDIGKILTVGGAKNYGNSDGTRNAYIININGGEGGETVQRTGSMNRARTLANSVVLPNGEVVVVGGQATSRLFMDTDSVFEAEIWNPITGEWKLLAPMDVPRNYHAVALLTKEGKVFAAGGGLCGSCSTNHPDYELLTPPYLINDLDGSEAERPEIAAAPKSIQPGDQTISVTMDKSGPHTFALMRLGASTHTTNNDNRRVPLQVVSRRWRTSDLDVPQNPNILIPGPYYLFGMNRDGVPSVGVFVSVES